MRTPNYLLSASVALLLASLPTTLLHGQQEDAMAKDPPQQQVDAMAQASSAEVKLMGAEGHKASGAVHLITTDGKRQLHFSRDFSLEKGPDVYVTLTNGPKPVEGSSVVVARLTKFSGEQSFELPSNIDLSRYSHLVLWCKKYSVAMGIAKLEDAEGHKEHQ
jgi:Electron transfer DM13